MALESQPLLLYSLFTCGLLLLYIKQYRRVRYSTAHSLLLLLFTLCVWLGGSLSASSELSLSLAHAIPLKLVDAPINAVLAAMILCFTSALALYALLAAKLSYHLKLPFILTPLFILIALCLFLTEMFTLLELSNRTHLMKSQWSVPIPLSQNTLPAELLPLAITLGSATLCLSILSFTIRQPWSAALFVIAPLTPILITVLQLTHFPASFTLLALFIATFLLEYIINKIPTTDSLIEHRRHQAAAFTPSPHNIDDIVHLDKILSVYTEHDTEHNALKTPNHSGPPLPPHAINQQPEKPPERYALMIESSEAGEEQLHDLLHRNGWRTHRAHSTKEAAHLLLVEHSDLLLVDLDERDADSEQVSDQLKQLHALRDLKSLPVILLCKEKPTEIQLKQLGAFGINAIMQKPVDPGTLLEILNKQADKTTHADTSDPT